MEATEQIERISDVITQAFYNLGINIKQDELDSMVNTVHQGMSGEGRYYHTPEHALALSDEINPVQTLAAVFHDLVYYQVDQGFSCEVWKIIEPYMNQGFPGEAMFKLRDEIPADDISFHLTKDIFGFSDGQELFTNGGSNEFLSSLVMIKKIGNIVPKKLLVQVAAYIEATIPFRTKEKNGTDPFDILAHRLAEVSENYNIPLSQKEIERTIQGAVVFSNCDVGNFSDLKTASFLENTWKLLPEINPVLRRGEIYSLKDYRVALQAMEKFIRSIKAEDVVHEYKGVPPKAEILEKLLNVRKNLNVGREYFEIKLLTMAILEALAEVSGGDGPISSFLGDVRKNGSEEYRFEGIIPVVETFPTEDDPDGILQKLLETGRRGPVDFADIRTAPIALYIYMKSGLRKIRGYLDSAQEMFAGKIKPAEFLWGLDLSMISIITEAVAQLAVTRREKLLSFQSESG